MEDSRRTRRAKRRGGRILRLLLLAAILILGFQAYQLGIFREIGGLLGDTVRGKAKEVVKSGQEVWDTWEGKEEPAAEPVGLENQEVLLDCVYLNQKELGYPTGCEAVTAVMALETAGVQISVEEFLELMPRGELYQKRGETYGPDPREVFVGDPMEKSGYGCYAPVIQGTVEKILLERRADLSVCDLTGSSLEELKGEIDRGNPVILWASREMGQITYKDSWKIEGRSAPYFWPRGEHCLLLTGYVEDYLFFNDPTEGEQIAYELSQVEIPYEELGSQALVIRREAS